MFTRRQRIYHHKRPEILAVLLSNPWHQLWVVRACPKRVSLKKKLTCITSISILWSVKLQRWDCSREPPKHRSHFLKEQDQWHFEAEKPTKPSLFCSLTMHLLTNGLFLVLCYSISYNSVNINFKNPNISDIIYYIVCPLRCWETDFEVWF